LVSGGQGFLGESDYVGTNRDGDRGMVEVGEWLEFGSEMGQAAPLSRRPATVLLEAGGWPVVGGMVRGLVMVMQRVQDYQRPQWPGESIVHLDLTAGDHLDEPEA